MKNEKTIFEVLFEKEICFAVNVSLNTFKGKGIDENSRDYFLIVQEQDLSDLKGMGFHRTHEYPNVLNVICQLQKYLNLNQIWINL